MENKNKSLITAIVGICVLLLVIGGGYAYYARDLGKPADKNGASDKVVDTKKNTVEHQVMKPPVSDNGKSESSDEQAKDAPKTDEPKSDQAKSDDDQAKNDKPDESKDSGDQKGDKSDK